MAASAFPVEAGIEAFGSVGNIPRPPEGLTGLGHVGVDEEEPEPSLG